jgi:hypothetical protein
MKRIEWTCVSVLTLISGLVIWSCHLGVWAWIVCRSIDSSPRWGWGARSVVAEFQNFGSTWSRNLQDRITFHHQPSVAKEQCCHRFFTRLEPGTAAVQSCELSRPRLNPSELKQQSFQPSDDFRRMFLRGLHKLICPQKDFG